MKLYKVPRNSLVKLLEDSYGPPWSRKVSKGDIVKFHHIDGMYSYCIDEKGNPVHLEAWTRVEIIKDAR